MCLIVVFFVSILFGTLCFLNLYIYFLHQIKDVSFIIFSSRFPISCSFSSPSGTPVMWMLECLKLSQRLLSLALCFWFFFFLLFWLNVFSYLCSKSLIWFLASYTRLLIPCKFFFISLSVNLFLSGSFLCCWSTQWVPWAS